jgi:hypothetical protein
VLDLARHAFPRTIDVRVPVIRYLSVRGGPVEFQAMRAPLKSKINLFNRAGFRPLRFLEPRFQPIDPPEKF